MNNMAQGGSFPQGGPFVGPGGSNGGFNKGKPRNNKGRGGQHQQQQQQQYPQVARNFQPNQPPPPSRGFVGMQPPPQQQQQQGEYSGGSSSSGGGWEWEQLAWMPLDAQTAARMRAAAAQGTAVVACQGPNGEAWMVDQQHMLLATVNPNTGQPLGAARKFRVATSSQPPPGFGVVATHTGGSGVEVKQFTGRWLPYAPQHAQLLQNAMNQRANPTVALHGGGPAASTFQVDLSKMIQTNPQSGTARNVRYLPPATTTTTAGRAMPGTAPRPNQPPPGPAFPGSTKPIPGDSVAASSSTTDRGPAAGGGAASASLVDDDYDDEEEEEVVEEEEEEEDEEPLPPIGQCAWPPPCFKSGCSAQRCTAREASFRCGHRGWCAAHNRSEAACALCGEPR